MRKIKIIFIFLMCLIINNALTITENDANQFVVDIGNQAIKILKIPVDDKAVSYTHLTLPTSG